MSQLLARLGLLAGFMLTLVWPMLLGGVIAGIRGVALGGMVYVVFGVLLVGVLAFGGIRGILGS